MKVITVLIKEKYNTGLDPVEYELDFDKISSAIKVCSSMLLDRPDIEVLIIICQDPKEVITITR